MKKFLTLAIAVLVIAMGSSAQNRSINFIEGKTFAEVKELAKRENKMIFIDFHTTWCGPCKEMDKEVFTNDSVADFYNQHFINIKIDAEKGEGVSMTKKYEVRSFPTLIFISTDGGMIHRSTAGKKTQEFIQLGESALDPNEQLSKKIDAYHNGKKDAQSTSKILDELFKVRLYSEVDKIISEYLARTKDQEVVLEMEWRIVAYANDVNSPGSQFIFRNYDKFLKHYGDSIMNNKIFWNNTFLLNKCASNTLKYEIDKDNLQRAVKWAERSVELSKYPDNLSTMASLLFQIGKFNDAIEVQTEALGLAQEFKYSSEKIKTFEANLKRFQQK